MPGSAWSQSEQVGECATETSVKNRKMEIAKIDSVGNEAEYGRWKSAEEKAVWKERER